MPRVTRHHGTVGLLTLVLALSMGLSPSLVTRVARTGEEPVVDRAAHAVERAERDAGRPRGRVLAVSVDGLTPRALRRLGPRATPHLRRLLREGASTLNARTQVEQTVTLPNHTSMVTGRAIERRYGGHGVVWNDDLPHTTVQETSGDPRAASVFSRVRRAGGSTAVFTTKSKLGLFRQSWPAAIDRSVLREADDAALVRALRRDLVRHRRALTFLHLGLPDAAGHARGWLSRPYLGAVRTVDRLLGSVLRTVRSHASLRRLRIVLTADHGGVPQTTSHGDATLAANYRVPFVVWGPGVAAGDLYRMNRRTRRDPGGGRPGFRGRQPVRNGELANVALDLLGLGPVPRSRWDRRQDLAWR